MTDTIRLGLLRLCDAAPVILAEHQHLFAEVGLNVELSIEPSWANIADKLAYGLLEGAVMLPPLALACAAGLRGRQVDLLMPMSLSANGNVFTLSTACQDVFQRQGMAALAAQKRLRLAVVHGFSSHDLLLRHWLAAQGVAPERDVDITVLPPAEMVGSLAAGAIDGFCAGAPWGRVAERAGMGFTAVLSRDIWPGHPEKCLAMRADFCRTDPDGLTVLLKVLLQAQLYVPNRRVVRAWRPCLPSLNILICRLTCWLRAWIVKTADRRSTPHTLRCHRHNGMPARCAAGARPPTASKTSRPAFTARTCL